MARILSFVKTLRNHWKKSIFGCVIITYGVQYAKGKYDCNVLMAEYCREALKYGNYAHADGSRIRNITVFLNPAANKRKAKKDFDKYCAPLLYLSGVFITVVQTKSQGEARLLAEQLDESVDAVIVAGGDGTLSETVTGLLRREAGTNRLSKKIPVGILPLGQTNTVAKSLLSENSSDKVKLMAEATMAVIKEIRKPVDVLRIEQLEKEREDQRPVYSVGGLKWGAVHDAYAKRDKYWYWGQLRTYMAYIFMGVKDDGKGVTWSCSADLFYSLPCNGCSECYQSQESIKRKTPNRWWQTFVPKRPLSFVDAESTALSVDYTKIKNDSCSKLHELKVESVDINLRALNGKEQYKQTDIPRIEVSIGPQSITYWDFVARGWQYIKGSNIESINILQVKDMKLLPNFTAQDSQHWFYIDNDDYEVKPIYIKLLPKTLTMFSNISL